MQGLRILHRGAVVTCRRIPAVCSTATVNPCIKLQSAYSTSPTNTPADGYKFVVVGGGTGGLAMASWLSRKHGKGQVAVVEPADVSLILNNC